MRRIHLFLRRLVHVAAVLSLCLIGYAYVSRRPQNIPWTRLDLSQPIGLFTGRKLASLTGRAAECRALLDRAGVAYSRMKPGGEGQCAYADAVRLTPVKDAIAWEPAAVAPSCPVAAALKLWEWQVVQPAAQRHFGRAVRKVTHFGAYSCRRLYGRSAGDFSEHATADAIDVAGFTLTDGHRIGVAADWKGGGKDADFLHEVRDGACGLFSTVLSPDYNAAHRDHLHLDQAERGAWGGRACR
ncbi:extensin-like domain-containing protein [Sphingobium sp. YBL2]|uniref:extensin-like domain-containing protein n=1 Tax=Sphingobium sp. (strain YBL2) TaxID=484429 RepID=UPI0005CB89F2|nr:extensin family protein [Sphingobium sp. YBL2]AJR24862.1 extensin [Sphingobium sp. YBL2]